MIQLRNSVVFLLILFFVSISNAQQNRNRSVIEWLKIAENRFDVNFSYLNEDVEDVKIDVVVEVASIDQFIKNIEQKSILQVRKVDKSTYVINKKPYCIRLKSLRTGKPITSFIYGSSNKSPMFKQGNLMHFSISADTITLTKKGFAEKRIRMDELSKGECLTVYLNRINQLEEVVLQDFLTKGLQLKDFGQLQLKPREYDILPGLINADVLQTAAQIPGIFSVDQRLSNISVRGGTHDQNLFLWNGARLYQTGHFFGIISALNPSIGRKIVIYKNASPAKYSRGTSSVFAISSDMDVEDEMKNEVAANMIASRFRTQHSLGKGQEISISGRRSFTDLFTSPTYWSFFDKVFQETALSEVQADEDIPLSVDENFWFFDTSLHYENEWNENNKTSLNALTIGTQLHFREINEQTNAIRNNELDQDSYIISLKHQHRWNSRFTSTMNPYFSYYQQNASDNTLNTSQALDQLNQVIDAGIAIDNHYQMDEKWQFDIGYEFSEIGIRNDVDVSNLSIIKQQKNVLRRHTGYLATDFSSAKLKANIGTNLAYFEAFDDIFVSPRLSVSAPLTNNLTANVLGEIKYQASSQVIDQQQDFFSVSQRRWVLANGDNIPIQESLQLDAGLTYKFRDWLVQLTAYHKQVEGINSRSQGFTNQLELLNLIGNYDVNGLEFLIQHQLEDWRFWSSYAFQDNTYEFNTFDPVFFTNNFERTHQLSAGISYTKSNFLLSLGADHFSGKPFTPIDEQQPINTSEINFLLPNSSHLKDHWQVNFTGAYRENFDEWRMKTGIGILNLTDDQQVSDRIFRLENDEVRTVQRQSLGITPNIFIQFYF